MILGWGCPTLLSFSEVIKVYEINCYDSYGNSIDYLTQWDCNRKIYLSLDYYELSDAPEVHFFNQNSSEALVVLSTISEGMVEVDVPNILLQEPYTIFAHVYVNENGSQKSIAYLPLLVRKKPKPSDYVYTNNLEKVSFVGIKSITQTEVDGTTTVTILLSDNTSFSFEIGSNIIETSGATYDYYEVLEVEDNEIYSVEFSSQKCSSVEVCVFGEYEGFSGDVSISLHSDDSVVATYEFENGIMADVATYYRCYARNHNGFMTIGNTAIANSTSENAVVYEKPILFSELPITKVKIETTAPFPKGSMLEIRGVKV